MGKEVKMSENPAKVWMETELAKLPPLPKEIEYRSGCKVAWRTYRTMKEAKIASKHAAITAAYYAHLGYDFGYSSPGFIHKNHSTRRYTVTFP